MKRTDFLLHWLTSVVSLCAVCRWYTTALCMAWRQGPDFVYSGDSTRSHVTISHNHILVTLTETKSGRHHPGWVPCPGWWSGVWVHLASSDGTPLSWTIPSVLWSQASVNFTLLGFLTSRRKMQISHRSVVKCQSAFGAYPEPQVRSIKKTSFASATYFGLDLHRGCQTSDSCIWKHVKNIRKYKRKHILWIYVA